jgi:ribosomal peptide maturation radical SAM protein 1
MLDVYLVSMPYAAVERPSLSLGILQASLCQHGFSAKVCYANMVFAEQIGLKNYFFFSNSFPAVLMGEWTFAEAAFPDFRPDYSNYFQECRQRAVSEKLLWSIRTKTPAFIERLAQQILTAQPRIVGCSSMFQQHCASLAVLKRIKALCPDVITLLGGAACEGSMGYVTHQQFDWLDYVVSGEAEGLLPELCRQIFRYGRDIPLKELPEGVYAPVMRNLGMSRQPITRAVVHNLDATPVPAYADYFDALKASPLAAHIKPALPFETSRGCWWGQKTHCVFCGTHPHNLTFRVKSPARILRELIELSQTYGLNKFMATDSIVDLKHFETVLPALAQAKAPYYFMFETPANLTRDQVKLLSEAGVLWINPGMESLHDHVLRLLKKGTSAWKNVQLLKWGMQYGVFVAWILLVNVPGESGAWYEEMLTWLPLISHLQPPIKQVFLHYDRFSPCHQDPERFNLTLEPSRFYAFVYPLAPDQLRDFAYYFDDISPTHQAAFQEKLPVFLRSQALITTWQNLFYMSRTDIVRKEVSDSRPRLDMQEQGDALIITYTRPWAVAAEIILEGVARTIYIACDAALTADLLIAHLQDTLNRDVSWEDIQPIVEQLLAQKILLRLDDRFLSLAVPAPYPKMLTHDDYPGGLVMIPRRK